MNWILPTTADALKGVLPAENKMLEHNQGSIANLASFITDTADEFRQAISDAGINITSAGEGTIPPGFRWQVAALALWRWITSTPEAKFMQTVARKDAAQEAKDLINDIATGKRPVAAPDATTGGIAGPSFGTRGGSRPTDLPAREFTDCKQDGI